MCYIGIILLLEMYSFFPTYFPYFRLFRTHTINFVETELVLLALALKDIGAPSLEQVWIACIPSHYISEIYIFCRICLTKEIQLFSFQMSLTEVLFKYQNSWDQKVRIFCCFCCFQRFSEVYAPPLGNIFHHVPLL